VLRNRHVAGLLLGDLLANAGTGMLIVAMPVLALSGGLTLLLLAIAGTGRSQARAGVGHIFSSRSVIALKAERQTR
jgi:hypothetical protein